MVISELGIMHFEQKNEERQFGLNIDLDKVSF